MNVKILLVEIIYWFFKALQFSIIARALLSWLPLGRDNPIVKFLTLMTEPLLAPIRSLISKSPLGGPGMMMDFSPVIGMLLVEVVAGLLIRGVLSL